jgi:hypothetical protein
VQRGGAGGSGGVQQGGAGGSGVHALHEHLVLHHALHAHVQAPSAAEQEEEEEEFDEDDGGEIEDEEEGEEEGVTTEFFPPEASHATIFLFCTCVVLHVDFGGFSACLLFS